MAENHPVGFKWVIDAREKGATIIHVDPRFTRTSAMADMWVPLRAGSDTVFLGAMVNFVLARGLELRTYIFTYANAATIIDASYSRPRGSRWPLLGLGREGRVLLTTVLGLREGRGPGSDASAPALGLSDPHASLCALHTGDGGGSTGVPADSFLRIADAFCRASGPERTGAICYAVGLTQHSAGVQIIRTAAILQLLGNIGRPGGGILALRGHASIQGSTDIPTLFDILPGYLPMPAFGANDATLESYVSTHQSRAGWWANFDESADIRCSRRGPATTPRENEFGFGWLRRISGDHSHFGYWLDMADGHAGDADTLSTDESARRPVRHGTEYGRRRAQRASRAPRARQPRLAGRARPGRDRDGDVLAGLSGGRTWRAPDRRNRHRSLLLPGGRARRERRMLHEYAAPAAMA